MGLLDGQPLERSKRLNYIPPLDELETVLTDIVGYSDTTVLYMLSLCAVCFRGPTKGRGARWQ
jgi:hypothetical protein